jgi:hypothetical protein
MHGFFKTENQNKLSLNEVIEMEPILHETTDLGAEIKRLMEEYSLVPPDTAFVLAAIFGFITKVT